MPETKLEIPEEEFRTRVKKVQGKLQERDIDGCLVCSSESEPQNVLYLSNYPTSWEIAAVFVPARGEPAIVTGPEGGSFARARSVIRNIIPVHEFRESAAPDYPLILPKTSMVDVLKEGGIRKRLGLIGYHVMRASLYEAIRDGLSDVELFWADEILNELKAVKSEDELAIMREAYKVAEAGMAAAAGALKEGVREWEVVTEAQIAMLRLGAGNTGFFVNSGPNTTYDFTDSTDRKISRGDMISIQVGANYGGYSGAISRPAVIGTPPPEIRSFVDAGRRACDTLLSEVKAGVPAQQVACAVVESLEKDGYGHTFRWGPAHGTGIYECEAPFLETTSDYVLKPDMTFNIDLYLTDGEKGYRFEEGFRVTETGAEEFCSFKRDLIQA